MLQLKSAAISLVNYGTNFEIDKDTVHIESPILTLEYYGVPIKVHVNSEFPITRLWIRTLYVLVDVTDQWIACQGWVQVLPEWILSCEYIGFETADSCVGVRIHHNAPIHLRHLTLASGPWPERVVRGIRVRHPAITACPYKDALDRKFLAIVCDDLNAEPVRVDAPAGARVRVGLATPVDVSEEWSRTGCVDITPYIPVDAVSVMKIDVRVRQDPVVTFTFFLGLRV